MDREIFVDRKARTANKGFAIAGVPCFADTFVQGGSSVLRTKFSAKTPRHRKPPKRYSKQETKAISYAGKTILTHPARTHLNPKFVLKITV